MDTVTYPEPAVADLVNGRFVPVKANVTEQAAASLVERYRQVWTPDIRVLGPDGFEYYRWNGYLPPFEFIPQLLVAEAQARLRTKDFTTAASIYEDVLRRFPTSEYAPEAQYFLAVARYRASREPADLRAGYERVRLRYPTSIWRVKQSYSEAG